MSGSGSACCGGVSNEAQPASPRDSSTTPMDLQKALAEWGKFGNMEVDGDERIEDQDLLAPIVFRRVAGDCLKNGRSRPDQLIGTPLPGMMGGDGNRF